jgi:hypothetical protein
MSRSLYKHHRLALGGLLFVASCARYGNNDDAGSDAFVVPGTDSGAHDASAPTDGYVAPSDAGLDSYVSINDTGVDAGITDMGVDAAVVCTGTMVNCGGTCVDLATSSANCGACGYAVVGARTCVSGQPSPGWLPIPTGPTSPTWSQAWTGHHLMQVNGASTYLFDPAAGTWNIVTGGAPPFATTRVAFTIEMADRGEVFVFGQANGASGYSDRAYVFVDDASPHWAGPYTIGSAPARDFVDLAYDGTSVFLAYGATNFDGTGNYTQPPTGLVFDAASRAFNTGLAISGPRVNVYTIALNSHSIAVLSGVTLSSGYTNDPNMYFNTPPAATYVSPVRVDSTVGEWDGHTLLLSLGDHGLVVDQNTGNTWLVNSSGSLASTQIPIAGGGRTNPFFAYTGRAVLYWGGDDASTVHDDGVVGVVNASGIASWQPLPLPNRPSAMFSNNVGSPAPHDSQRMWSGRELMVFGGYTTNAGAWATSGGRYQPPVGCVCPINPGAPTWLATNCASVATPAAPYDTCVPQ